MEEVCKSSGRNQMVPLRVIKDILGRFNALMKEFHMNMF